MITLLELISLVRRNSPLGDITAERFLRETLSLGMTEHANLGAAKIKMRLLQAAVVEFTNAIEEL